MARSHRRCRCKRVPRHSDPSADRRRSKDRRHFRKDRQPAVRILSLPAVQNYRWSSPENKQLSARLFEKAKADRMVRDNQYRTAEFRAREKSCETMRSTFRVVLLKYPRGRKLLALPALPEECAFLFRSRCQGRSARNARRCNGPFDEREPGEFRSQFE